MPKNIGEDKLFLKEYISRIHRQTIYHENKKVEWIKLNSTLEWLRIIRIKINY